MGCVALKQSGAAVERGRALLSELLHLDLPSTKPAVCCRRAGRGGGSRRASASTWAGMGRWTRQGSWLTQFVLSFNGAGP